MHHTVLRKEIRTRINKSMGLPAIIVSLHKVLPDLDEEKIKKYYYDEVGKMPKEMDKTEMVEQLKEAIEDNTSLKEIHWMMEQSYGSKYDDLKRQFIENQYIRLTEIVEKVDAKETFQKVNQHLKNAMIEYDILRKSNGILQHSHSTYYNQIRKISRHIEIKMR